MFDPYHRWLAIPPTQRPPTYYQLLGVAREETDPEVIAEAALRQISHIRTYQTGPHAKECQTLLNEIGLAKVTLLNPEKRRAYEARIPPLNPGGGNDSLPETDSSQEPLYRQRPGALPWGYAGILMLGAALAFWLARALP